MIRWKGLVFVILMVLISNGMMAATSGYTYRVMERRKLAKQKRLQQEQINSKSYQNWQKGFIKRVRCLSVNKDTASDALRASCFNLPPKGQSGQNTTQVQPEK